MDDNSRLDDLLLEPTQSSPLVRCEWQEGVIRMKGESYPENSYELYSSILSWMEGLPASNQRPLSLELELNYLNTTSVRAMIEIFDQLQLAADGGRAVQVQW